jgi:hypothetical protein
MRHSFALRLLYFSGQLPRGLFRTWVALLISSRLAQIIVLIHGDPSHLSSGAKPLDAFPRGNRAFPISASRRVVEGSLSRVYNQAGIQQSQPGSWVSFLRH